MNKHKFPYRWNLADGYPAKGIENHGCTVFGTFVCAGGSTMGYKLAGYNHLGGVEIDPKVADVYKKNHKPKHFHVEDIREFVKRKDLPKELYNLDLLDGSPPCSSFSMAGNREKDWGKAKKFREGQSLQTLDDLFFDYIELAKKLQPKVIIAENVKGMLIGNAKSYVRRIKTAFEKAGYIVQLFLLNAATMGVPQKRERVFFVCRRKDLPYADLKLQFDEPAITYGDYRSDKGVYYSTHKRQKITKYRKHTDTTIADINKRLYGKVSGFNAPIVHDHAVVGTITSGEVNWRHCDGLGFTREDYILTGSFPLDFDFRANEELHAKYYIGMSVPPVMTAQIAHQIYLQWLKAN